MTQDHAAEEKCPRPLDFVLPDGWTPEEAEALQISFDHGQQSYGHWEERYTGENLTRLMLETDKEIAQDAIANPDNPITRETVVAQSRNHDVLTAVDDDGNFVYASAMQILLNDMLAGAMLPSEDDEPVAETVTG